MLTMRDPGCADAIATRSGPRNQIMVDLLRGWSTEAESGSSSSTALSGLDGSPIKRSASQEASILSTQETVPLFQTISLPNKDVSLAVSLYTGCKSEQEMDQEELERIKRLPPSKRPGVSHAKRTPPNHIKRPRNAYIIFRSHIVSQKLIPKEVENDHRNISRIIAHMWKSLEPQERAQYEQIAKQEKERHKQLFPEYRYRPTTRRTGVSKRNVKKLENGEEECQEIADIILKAQGKEGVIVRGGPSKAIKRARKATRASVAARNCGKPSSPRAKRARVDKPKPDEPVPPSQAADEGLETIFLHPSPSQQSPTLSPSYSPEAESVPTPEPRPESSRMTSRTPSIDRGQPLPSSGSALMLDISEMFGRRSSSVPVVHPCSPTLAFIPPTQENTDAETLGTHQDELGTHVADAGDGYTNHFSMPAPRWKGRKTIPAPIANTWQFCSYDDQSLPSPQSFDSFASASKMPAARPRTAWPSTPSSSTFRGFFHPWAVEHNNDSMLISPMTASFQDLRRRSSLARSGLSATRRPGSFGVDVQPNSSGRLEGDVGTQALLQPSSGARLPDGQLFGEAHPAAAVHLNSEIASADYDETPNFAFDPALEGEGRVPAAPDSVAEQPCHSDRSLAAQVMSASPRSQAQSPRPSFSGSTLAAAARDWASMKRRRSKMAQTPIVNAVSESLPAPIDSSDSIEASMLRETDKPGRLYGSSLEESVERAVMLALSKDHGQDSNLGERNSNIVQQILSLLSTELALQSQNQQEHQQFTPSICHADKAPLSFVESRPRACSRASRGVARPNQYYAANAAIEGGSSRLGKPLPSPLQLVTSNYEIGTSTRHSHSYSSPQHCI